MRIIAGVCLAVSILEASADAQAPAKVRVTNSHLQVACVDGRPSAQRKWELPARPVSMIFTMRNQPRTGRPGADAGWAAIEFTPQPGHAYEIEVRSEPLRYSDRVWPKGEWRPVVRDRTTDQIVSGEPAWFDHACTSAREP